MNINHLLQKYWDVETSLNEEQQLQNYFNSDNVSDEHIAFKPLFQTYGEQKSIRLKTPLLEPKQKTKVFRLRNIAVAASILLALAVVFNTNKTKSVEINSNVVNVETPEEALAYTMNALALVSSKLSRGSEVVVNGMKPLHKANILIN